MVLSNRKLKQKLREAKAELLATAEAQNQFTNNNFQNPETPDSETQEFLNSIVASASQKPRLSKREKRRQKAPSLQENDGKLNKFDDARPEGVVEGKKKKKKRKRYENQELGNGEVNDEQLNKVEDAPSEGVVEGKKKKKKRKRDKNQELENGEVNDEKLNKVEDAPSEGVVEGKKKKEKRKRDKNQELGNGEVNDEKLNKVEDAPSEGMVEDKKKKKKRKRDENQELENGEVEKVKKLSKKKNKKKKKKKKKGKKKEENGEVSESIFETEAGKLHDGVARGLNNDNSEESLDACNKVYVGGIPYYSSEDDIRSYFEGCGTITEIDCMKFPESGKFRGIAIITFKTEAAAMRALALDGSDMGGLFLKIQPYKSARVTKTSNFSPKVLEGYNRIYAGNLSWDITEDDLRNFFSGCNITSIRFGEDKETGEFRGYAHVDFSDSLSLNRALKLDQTVVCGRPIRISCAVPKRGSENKIGLDETKELKSNVNPQESNTTENNQAAGDGAIAVSGKTRRRTCYECGERGHLSSSCRKKQEADKTSLLTS